MLSTNEALFWKKKEFASFILSVLVFFIHTSSFARYVDADGFVSLFNEKAEFVLKNAVTRFAVPMFFILSGISFFRGYDNSKYFAKIRSRIFTLVIPYLIWNTIWMVFEIACSYTFLSSFFAGREPFALTSVNILKGIFFYQYNVPFWFVLDLIIFSLAAPLVHLLVRNKYIGIASIGLFAILADFGVEIPASIFYYPLSIVFFLMGALIGEHYFDLATRRSKKETRYFSAIFLVTYIVLKTLFPDQQHPLKTLSQVVVFALAAFSLWNIIDTFAGKLKPRKIYSRSFAIYAMHFNIATVMTSLVFLCLPKNGWMALPNFVITVLLTLILINFICSFLEKNLPKVYSILMGNRLRRNKNT